MLKVIFTQQMFIGISLSKRKFNGESFFISLSISPPPLLSVKGNFYKVSFYRIHEEKAGEILFHLEILIVIWFSIEFFVRLWAAGNKCSKSTSIVSSIWDRSILTFGLSSAVEYSKIYAENVAYFRKSMPKKLHRFENLRRKIGIHSEMYASISKSHDTKCRSPRKNSRNMFLKSSRPLCLRWGCFLSDPISVK